MKLPQVSDQRIIQIKKVKSKEFAVSGDASFTIGAGISFLPNGDMVLFTAPGDIGGLSTISVFRP